MALILLHRRLRKTAKRGGGFLSVTDWGASSTGKPHSHSEGGAPSPEGPALKERAHTPNPHSIMFASSVQMLWLRSRAAARHQNRYFTSPLLMSSWKGLQWKFKGPTLCKMYCVFSENSLCLSPDDEMRKVKSLLLYFFCLFLSVLASC